MEKIKQFLTSDKGKDVLTILIVILVGLGSFGLGRLSKSSTSGGIKIEYPKNQLVTEEASAISAINPQKARISKNSKSFFASSRGSKYYSIGCAAGNNIKQENRIYFATASEAEGAGYELSSSCK